MRSIVVVATAASLVAIAPAQASIVTLGSSNAEACYRAAEARDTSRDAKEACDRALTGDALSRTEQIATHVNRGIVWMVAGDLGRANWDFDRALAMNPNEPEAWLNKAIAQMKAGNSRAALQMTTRSIELRTRKPAIAHYVRGLANEDVGNLQTAYADLKRARALAPKWSEPAIELARYQVRSR